MLTRVSLPGLLPVILILTGLALPARPVHAATEVKVTAEQEQTGEDPIQLKIDIECLPVIPGNPNGICHSGANPAKGSVECERVVTPVRPPVQHNVTCVLIADGTSTFYSGPNGCSGTAEASWIIGVVPGTQLVRALPGVMTTVCGLPISFNFDNATIEASVNNKQ